MPGWLPEYLIDKDRGRRVRGSRRGEVKGNGEHPATYHGENFDRGK